MRAFLITVVAVVGMMIGLETGAFAANPSRPSVTKSSVVVAAQTAVPFEAGPGSVYTSTNVVHAGDAEWTASATVLQGEANLITVDQWHAPKWSVAAKVSLPQLPYLEPGDSITTASLTHSGVPDFVITTAGADTPWLAVIARIDGRWQAAPFDFEGGASRVLVGVLTDGRLEAEVDGCSCASGTETYTYYRWGNGIFVPTTPPGRGLGCTAPGLERAPVVPTSDPPMDPLLQTALSRPLSIDRSACADGWALASISSRDGPQLALFNQQGAGWRRVAVGSARNLAKNADEEFAISGPQLVALAARIGEIRALEPMPKVPTTQAWGTQTLGLSSEDRATVALNATPGSSYATSQVSAKDGQSWFATATEPRESAPDSSAVVSSNIFRWSGTSWSRQAVVGFALAMAGGEEPVGVVASGALTGSPAPDFEIGGFGSPAWITVVSHAGGTWHFVPFEVAGRSMTSVEAAFGPIEPVESVEVQERLGQVPYDYVHGAFRPSGPELPTPPCNLAVFERLAGSTTTLRSASCGYGYAVGTGTQDGKPIQLLFDSSQGTWSLNFASSVRAFRSEAEQSGSPKWLIGELDPGSPS